MEIPCGLPMRNLNSRSYKKSRWRTFTVFEQEWILGDASMNYIALPTVFQVVHCIVLWSQNLPIAAKIALSAVAVANCILFFIVAAYSNRQLVVNCLGLICISLCIVQSVVSFVLKSWALLFISTVLGVIELIWYISMMVWVSKRGEKE